MRQKTNWKDTRLLELSWFMVFSCENHHKFFLSLISSMLELEWDGIGMEQRMAATVQHQQPDHWASASAERLVLSRSFQTFLILIFWLSKLYFFAERIGTYHWLQGIIFYEIECFKGNGNENENQMNISNQRCLLTIITLNNLQRESQFSQIGFNEASKLNQNFESKIFTVLCENSNFQN